MSSEKFRATFLNTRPREPLVSKMLPFVSFCQPDGWSSIDDETENGWDCLNRRQRTLQR